MPGTDNIFVLTESAVKGAKNGIAISAGLAGGLLIHTTFAASGLSVIFANSKLAYDIIKYLGAAYLIYLAVQSYIHRKNFEDSSRHNGNRNIMKLIGKGFILNITNPKVSLFFIAFFPQFVNPDAGQVITQMFILGLIFMFLAFIIFSTIAIISGSLKQYINNYKFRLYTNYSRAIILFILGIMIIFTE